ncbi:MAG: hypothetical protein ACI9SY_000498 [Candidatus Paceibacteria bacterium]
MFKSNQDSSKETTMSEVLSETQIPLTHYDEPKNCLLAKVRQEIWKTTNYNHWAILKFDTKVKIEQRDFRRLDLAIQGCVHSRYPKLVHTFEHTVISRELWKKVNKNFDLYLDVYLAAIEACPTAVQNIFE